MRKCRKLIETRLLVLRYGYKIKYQTKLGIGLVNLRHEGITHFIGINSSILYKLQAV